MWPFRSKAAPARFLPTPPFVDGERWATLGGTVTSVTPQAAEALAAVLSATNLIATGIASLDAYVVTNDDAQEQVRDHPLQRLIDYGVGPDESWSDFLEGFVASILLRGNALAALQSDDRGRLVGLRTLPWQFVIPWVDDTGELLFDFTPTLPPNAGKRRRYLRDDVLFVKDRSDDAVIGRSRLSRAAQSLQSAIDLQRQSTQFLGNASRPAGALTSPGRISKETSQRLADDWDSNYNGDRKGKTAVLPEGLKFEVLSLLSAEDQQLILHKNFSVEDVARVFNVPAYMLSSVERTTYASAKESVRFFAMSTLNPLVVKLQRAFAQSVLSSKFRLIIDISSLTRADPEARWASWQRARLAGILSPNEIRAEEGWPASTDPNANSIAPPVIGGAQPPTAGAADGGGKVAPLSDFRYAAD